MKVSLIATAIILLLLTGLQSCFPPDDKYYNLSDDAKSFLLFDVNDTFKLKNLSTDEVITLTITSKEIFFDNSVSSLIYLGPLAHFEKGVYRFMDSIDCYSGEVSLLADRDGAYELKANLCGCFLNFKNLFEYQDEFFSTIDVEGIEYQNAYLLNSFQYSMYYSKENGILKITDDLNQTTLFSYVE